MTSAEDVKIINDPEAGRRSYEVMADTSKPLTNAAILEWNRRSGDKQPKRQRPGPYSRYQRLRGGLLPNYFREMPSCGLRGMRALARRLRYGMIFGILIPSPTESDPCLGTHWRDCPSHR